MVLTPSAPWIEWTIQPQMAVADEISYKIKGSPKENDEALTEDELQLVQMCNSINPAALYNSFADKKKFRRQTDFEDKADDAARKFVHNYADAKLGKCIETAFALGVPMFVRRKHIDGIYIDKQLTLNDELNPLIGFHKGEETTKYVLQFEYPDDEHTVCTPSQCKWVVLNEEPGLVLEDDTRVFTLPEGFSGKRVKPFLAKEAIMVPSRTEREYFRKFIWKNVSDADLDVSGFELDNVEVEPKSFIILNRSKKGDPTLKLCFQYSNHIVYTGNVQKRFVSFKEQDESFRFLCIDRQFDKEQAATDAVVALGCTPAEGTFFQLDYTPQRNRWCQLMEWYRNNREALAAAGVALIQKRMSPQVFLGDFKIEQGFSKLNDWFELHLTIRLDDKRAITIGDIRENILDDNPEYLMPEGDIFIIPDELMAQYAKAMLVARRGKRGGLLVHRSAWGQTDLQTDDTVDEIADAPVPSALKAELRSYQTEGYRWMYRLQQYNCGACLADDMGLGKTIQTIALLLSKAKEGASLVIMPTSVLLNWKNELNRFAPSLNPVILRDSSDRAETINNAGAQDVVFATYGLLPTEEDILTSKKWNVIVLDEAHTIKNKETKTSKVAMQLEGNFRLILTGTPLQNHLSEIWNLFQFATPGLLTGYTQFTREFINPIEKDHIKEPQRLLKRMLQPFILRRTKNEVLNELPEKTEITLKVELSDAERALYDRFREEAVLNLEEGSTTAIKALAELTKLRQTACNPALVLPAKEAKNIPSSKMETFLKLVDELIHNHHRALVFSQFTSHLALVEKELKRLNIDYQYLDGSVSPTERIKRVSEFQKGDMPLFLISLKTGGTGLNLTAADYVIHLDPWWNPAIEDQASDRAYRIGQDKPVTVYRLIAENTIEEKIIALHQTKKSLADALLEGSDMASTLGKDEILNLIRGN